MVSNLAVAWGVLNAGRRPPRSRFIKVPLDLRDANGLATLSMICTVVPGTVWSELALDRSILLLHVFDLDDEAQFIEHFKADLRAPADGDFRMSALLVERDSAEPVALFRGDDPDPDPPVQGPVGPGPGPGAGLPVHRGDADDAGAGYSLCQ